MITNENNIKKLEKKEENSIMTVSKNYYMLFAAVTGLRSTTEVDFSRVTEEFILYLNELVKSLEERKQKIVELRFGLVDGTSRTLEDVAKVLGVTRERIRSFEAMALRSLRKSFSTEFGNSIIEEAQKSGMTFEEITVSKYLNKSDLENNIEKPQLLK